MINWRLLNDDIIVIDNKNIECEYEVDKFLKYVEDDSTTNCIDLIEKVYVRENNEFMFKIDFLKKTFDYTLKSENITVQDKIVSQITIENNKINLKYELDKEAKEIIIQLL